MTVEEIFGSLSAHMIKGLMIHDQLANYYDFLGLHGFKRCHEYHYRKESASYRELCGYYINHYSKLTPDLPIDNPNTIPESWYRYTRQDVDANTKKKAVKDGLEKWVSWETETKSLYQNMYDELLDIQEVDAAMFIGCLIKDVSHELKHAERKQLCYSAVGYDIGMIVSEQHRLHKKYKKKIDMNK